MKKIKFTFSKVSVSAYKGVRLQECINKEFDWEVHVKTGIKKGVTL